MQQTKDPSTALRLIMEEPHKPSFSEPVPAVAKGNEDPAPSSASRSGNERRGPRLCRFFSQGRYCQFGKRCRFLHQYKPSKAPAEASAPNNSGKADGQDLQDSVKETSAPSDSTSEAKALAGCTGKVLDGSPSPQSTGNDAPVPPEVPRKASRPKKQCRYFRSGYCALESRCRFWHPEPQLPLSDGRSSEGGRDPQETKPLVKPLPVARPCMVREEMKLHEITPELAKRLKETEVAQLVRRFPKDKLIIQEREDGKVTYYRITVEPTDPDWPFDLKEMDIMVNFPDDYPLQVFTLSIPEDQDLPSVMGRHICQASEKWLQAKYATNQLLGKVELLFRPFLHWLDRNMEKLFTEGARLLKRDIEAEKAGIEFVPYQQLQAAMSASSVDHTDSGSPEEQREGDVVAAESEICDGEGDSDSWTSCDEEDLEPDIPPGRGKTAASTHPSREDASYVRFKGTEIRFIGLQLSEGIGTLVAQKITVSLQCNRCKVTADLSMASRHPCTAQCEKCSSHISATFQPTMLHQYTALLGRLELQGAVPVDLVLQDCVFVVSCLNCSQEGPVQSLSYGLNKEMNCLHCHTKLTVLVETTRFQKIEGYSEKSTGDKAPVRQKKLVRDPAIQPGKPLPEHGTCRHYRKSCRWLRFPCCGKAYPCDVCHNERQNHEMELASRMICGYCAKEQPYSNGKPCIACGNMLSKGAHSSHWEGGQGCRNKTKMSRKDKQKYANLGKTISRRTVALQKK
ncbi:uncharacterized protein LOC115075507 isoform X2 [Rhinatrema bivittatum]|uniref:uncharacterized protein LOC115075507 isoform X2 n=1 Tax=Rhinatrema bivittatum TaxID=194408 RepID=UPI00112EB088|nr:uncharacterized protein LOC115075507 isoform X2 [Rhinatrema bivittatum]